MDDGMSYKHVAETFNVGHATVRKYLPGRGWTHAQVVEQAALAKRLKRIKVMC